MSTPEDGNQNDRYYEIYHRSHAIARVMWVKSKLSGHLGEHLKSDDCQRYEILIDLAA